MSNQRVSIAKAPPESPSSEFLGFPSRSRRARGSTLESIASSARSVSARSVSARSVSARSVSARSVRSSATDAVLKSGELERWNAGGWEPCWVFLLQDQIWLAREGWDDEDGVLLLLGDCDGVAHLANSAKLTVETREVSVTLRANSPVDAKSWVLAVLKQAAIVKEQEVLDRAERALECITMKQSATQLGRLQMYHTLPEVLQSSETRALFFDFARSEHEAWLEFSGCQNEARCSTSSASSGTSSSDGSRSHGAVGRFGWRRALRVAWWEITALIGGREESEEEVGDGESSEEQTSSENPAPCAARSWPKALTPEDLIACLERRVAMSTGKKLTWGIGQRSSDEVAGALVWVFADDVLLPKFVQTPQFQDAICRLVSGIPS